MSETMNIAAARGLYGEHYQAFQARTKERDAVQRELDAALERVNGCQAGMRSADGLPAVKAAQAKLTEAEAERSALVILLDNVGARAKEAAKAEQAAHDVLVGLERSAETLRAERIPQLEAALSSRRARHAELQRAAEAYRPVIQEAERNLAAARAELAALDA